MLHKISLFLLLLASLSGYATHLRSGEISYQPVPGQANTFLITFTIYTNASIGIIADVNTLPVSLGDGTNPTLTRQNGDPGYDNQRPAIYCNHLGELVTPIIRKNIFTVVHTYNGSGSFIISTAPSARNLGIVNMPSGNLNMYVASMLTVGNGLALMSSPVLSFPPIGDGCINTVYKFSPGAIDPDGDELRYELVRCKTTGGVDILSYKYPNELDPTGNTIFNINPRSGLITWNMPTIQGEYNISFKIEKYRLNVLVGYILRDMQVTIAPCANHPPSLDPIPDICVQAGAVINYKVTSTDIDGDTLVFTTTGMPYELSVSPATYTPDTTGPYIGATSGTFHWNTSPIHFSKNPYQVYYKVTDSHMGSSLTDIASNLITITATAVKNVSATVFKKGFTVKWEQSVYPQAIGYNIYRRTGISPFNADSCNTKLLLNSGYSLVGTVNDPTTLSYVDLNKGNGLPSGYYYCYVVTALFDGGAESAPSAPSCGLLMYPFINVLQDTLNKCQGSTFTIDTTVIQFINADQNTLYSWSSSPGDLQLTNADKQQVSVKMLTTGLHTLQIISTSGAYIDTAKIYFNVFPIPIPKITYKDLSGIPQNVVFYNRSTYAVSAIWQIDGTSSANFDSVSYSFGQNGYYRIYLKVFNRFGCPDTTSIVFRAVMKGVEMPNAFEPENSSSDLNTFRPKAIGLQTYFFGVWDLWGNLVWSSEKLKDNDSAEGWDGNDSKGRKMPSQNYIWRMKATFIDGTVWKGIKDGNGKFHMEGTFTLLR